MEENPIKICYCTPYKFSSSRYVLMVTPRLFRKECDHFDALISKTNGQAWRSVCLLNYFLSSARGLIGQRDAEGKGNGLFIF